MTEPVSYLASDDLLSKDRFEIGKGCIGYSDQEIVFIIPTVEGWVEITQNNKINQPLTLKLNNKAPKTNQEKVDLTTGYQNNGPFHILDTFILALPPQQRPPFLTNPTVINYSNPELSACMQIDATRYVITGKPGWIFEIRPKSEILDPRANSNKDNNMFMHYVWRVVQDLRNLSPTRKDLIWIAYEQKMMVIASTTLN